VTGLRYSASQILARIDHSCAEKVSAGALVDNLMRAQPSYIRTIKSNQNRSATEYDTKAILHQIKYLGLQENIRVRRAGFAYRNTFDKMVERFYLLSPSTSYAGEYTWQGDAKSGCERILKDTGIAKDEWQMGVTKAFIKNPETVSAPYNDTITPDSPMSLPAVCPGNDA
jgi:myosin-1